MLGGGGDGFNICKGDTTWYLEVFVATKRVFFFYETSAHLRLKQVVILTQNKMFPDSSQEVTVTLFGNRETAFCKVAHHRHTPRERQRTKPLRGGESPKT